MRPSRAHVEAEQRLLEVIARLHLAVTDVEHVTGTRGLVAGVHALLWDADQAATDLIRRRATAHTHMAAQLREHAAVLAGIGGAIEGVRLHALTTSRGETP